LLKQLYPSAIPCNDFGVSDVKLPDSLFSPVERNFRAEVFNIATVAALLPYKGHKFLLEALSQIKTERSWRLHLVGDGFLEEQLKSLSRKLGIRDNVVFHGYLDWSPGIMEILDSSHLFVLSSLTEGMPRVVLEGMARALPVISTDVGGVSEVINPEWLVPIKNSASFATKISTLWKNPELLKSLSSQNYNRIQDFRFDRLNRMRREWLTWMKLHGHEADCVSWKDYCEGHKLGFLNNA
jgi:glycosyltransferase involved in cell wall biosynthesis